MNNTFKQKIEELENAKKKLIQKRLDEFLAIVKKLSILDLDNDLIIAALSYAKTIEASGDKKDKEELLKHIPARFRK